MSTRVLLTAICDTPVEAARAVDGLEDAGFERNTITLLFAEDERHAAEAGENPATAAADPIAEEPRRATKIGAVLGGTLAAVAAAAVSLTGLGLVAVGPLASLLAAGAVGATAGGVLGRLMGLGIRSDIARAYERHLEEGAMVVGVTTTAERLAEAEALLMQAGGHSLAQMQRED